VTGKHRTPHSIENYLGAATVILSTAACLLGSPQLAVVAVVIGAVAYGVLIGTQAP
jgi:hypothetical protein